MVVRPDQPVLVPFHTGLVSQVEIQTIFHFHQAYRIVVNRVRGADSRSPGHGSGKAGAVAVRVGKEIAYDEC